MSARKLQQLLAAGAHDELAALLGAAFNAALLPTPQKQERLRLAVKSCDEAIAEHEALERFKKIDGTPAEIPCVKDRPNRR